MSCRLEAICKKVTGDCVGEDECATAMQRRADETKARMCGESTEKLTRLHGMQAAFEYLNAKGADGALR